MTHRELDQLHEDTHEKMRLIRTMRRRLEPLRIALLADWRAAVEPTDELLERTSEYVYLSDLYLRLGMEVQG